MQNLIGLFRRNIREMKPSLMVRPRSQIQAGKLNEGATQRYVAVIRYKSCETDAGNSLHDESTNILGWPLRQILMNRNSHEKARAGRDTERHPKAGAYRARFDSEIRIG